LPASDAIARLPLFKPLLLVELVTTFSEHPHSDFGPPMIGQVLEIDL
jgi:hypothetical protein